MELNNAESPCYRNDCLTPVLANKISFFIHTRPYIHLRPDSRIGLIFSNCEADIDVSIIFGEAAHNFCGEVRDIMLLRVATAKVFGSYHVVQGNIGTYNVNPNSNELKCLSYLHIGPEAQQGSYRKV